MMVQELTNCICLNSRALLTNLISTELFVSAVAVGWVGSMFALAKIIIACFVRSKFKWLEICFSMAAVTKWLSTRTTANGTAPRATPTAGNSKSRTGSTSTAASPRTERTADVPRLRRRLVLRRAQDEAAGDTAGSRSLFSVSWRLVFQARRHAPGPSP